MSRHEPALPHEPAVLTRAERTAFTETSLHADVMEFLREMRRLAPDRMRVGSMGHSAEGRDMPVVVLSDQEAFTSAAARRVKKPIVMVNANIHAGEVEGKEALLAFIREMTIGPLRPLLDQLTLVFVPILNPDGNDRISPENRRLDLQALEGQINPPGGVGTRNTGEGWNLNRDYMKQEAVESNNLARLYGEWWPHVFIDCHTTDGSIHAYDLTYDTAHTPLSGHPGPIEYVRTRLLPAVTESVWHNHRRRGFFYGNYVDQDDPKSGWETYPGLPRFGSHYRGLTGRLDILLETYSYIDYPARVETISAFLLEIFRHVATHADEVMSVADAAEQETIARGHDPQPDDLVGINYGAPRRAADGKLVFDWPVHHLEDAKILAYDLESIRERRVPGRRQATYRTSHRARFIPTVSVPRPYAYLVTAGDIAAKLRQHNVELQELSAAAEIDVEAYVVLASEKTESPDICTGIERFETVLSVRKERRSVRFERGTLMIPTAQRLGNLVVYLLEPESDDGLARWEFFDASVQTGQPFPVYRVPDSEEAGARSQAKLTATTMRVVGTAGHVDHGKSTLIRALTGIDPDRLQEEKDRGMTIDLGFAWLRLPSGQEVSIVDVPGHERFIKNMLAGVGGIDIALLVVAADEGVMPQTREHLAILDLLGIRSGVVALTKRDLVDDEWLDLVQAETEELLSTTSLTGAPVLPVSSTTGAGLDALLDELDRLLADERQRRQTGWPRLPVDRVFTMSGFGTVVTGTLIDGELRVGQEAELVPSGHRARIRGLQSHRRRVDAAPGGTRVAANLSGLATEEIERGEVLTAPGWLKATRVVDVRLRVVRDAPRSLPHNAQVTFHTGAAEALGKVSLLENDELRAGESGMAQVRLDRPIAAVKGDLFVLRLPAPNITIGGGAIVDEHPKRHRRYQERVLTQLAVLEGGSPDEVLVQTLQSKEPAELGELAKRAASTVAESQSLLRGLVERGAVIAMDGSGGLSSTTLLMSAQGWQRLASTTQQTLDAYHALHPLRRGMPREELRARLGVDARAFAPIERELFVRGVAANDGPFVRLPEFNVKLSPEDERRADDLVQALVGAGTSPPGRAELVGRFRVSDELVDVLVDRGRLVQVGPDLIYERAGYEVIVERIRELIRESGPVTVAQVRDTFDTSRKYALAILEHLDNTKVTLCVGDERVLA